MSPNGVTRPHWVNSFPQGQFGCNLKLLFLTNFQTHIKDGYFEHFQWNCPQVNAAKPHWWEVTQNSSLGTHCEIALRWTPQNLTNSNSIVVKLMAWWCKATGIKATLYRRIIFSLTHLPLVLHICVSELGQHWFRSAPSHYLNQRWLIINWTLHNKL